MPRRRKSGLPSQSFHLRWHSLADPTTPSVDLMSSPDPLNDPTLEILSPTRPLARSVRSQRFGSLGTSPRKRRIYELKRADLAWASPDTLPVEDELEDTTIIFEPHKARRKLFQSGGRSPTMRRMERATTTSVPLRDSNEADEISREQGRRPKSNGTPMPKSAMKRVADAPIDSPPRRRRAMELSEEDATDALLDESVELTPRSRKRGRPSKPRTIESPRGIGASPRRLGSARKRRLALLPDELANAIEDPFVKRSETVNNPSTTPNGVSRALRAVEARSSGLSDAGSDIWMTTMDDEATPQAADRSSRTLFTDSPLKSVHEPTPPQSDDHARRDDVDDGDDYDDPALAGSDHSEISEGMSEQGRNNDTIARGEDFSMIFMDSIPSLAASFHANRSFHGKSSVMRPADEAEEELGDETNLLINNTLESIRQEVAQSNASETSEHVNEEREEGEEEGEERGGEDALTPAEDQVEEELEEEAVDVAEEEATAEMEEEAEEEGEEGAEEELGEHVEEQLEEEAGEVEEEAEEEVEGEVEEEAEEGVEEEAEEEVEQEAEEEAEEGDQTIIQEGPVTEILSPSAQREAGLIPRLTPSPWWSRKAKKMGFSPLRHQVLRSSAKRASLSAVEIVARRYENTTPTRMPRKTIATNAKRSNIHLYDDSISDISHDTDAATTPSPKGILTQPENQELRMENGHDDARLHRWKEARGKDQGSEGESGGLIQDADIEPNTNGEVEQDFPAEGEPEQSRDVQDQYVHTAESPLRQKLNGEEKSEAANSMVEDPVSSTAGDVYYPQLRRSPTPEIIQPDLLPEETEDLVELVSSAPFPRTADLPSEPSERRKANGHMTEKSMHVDPEPRSQSEPIMNKSDQPAKVTPIHQMSSPIQTPESVVQEALHEKTTRPVLSSILRAGRVLQNVTSDPASPGERERHLGSPFRSSASKDSLQASKDVFSKRLLSRSPPKPLDLTESRAAAINQTQPRSYAANMWGDDMLQSPVVDLTKDERNAEVRDDHRPPSRESATGSMRNTPSDDEVMSWVENEGPISPSLRGDVLLRETARLFPVGGAKQASVRQPLLKEPGSQKFGFRDPITRAQAFENPVEEAVTRQHPIAVGQIDGTAEETEEESQGDDETDIWDFEARRNDTEPTPRKSATDKPESGRIELSTPMAGNSIRRSDNSIMKSSRRQPNEMTNGALWPDEVEDYSMVSYNRPRKETEPAKESSRFDLSAFFSSPAAIPGILAQKLFPTKARAPEPKSKHINHVQHFGTGEATNSMFPQAPPKTFASRHAHRTDLFSSNRPSEVEKQNVTPKPKETDQPAFYPPSAQTAATVTPTRMQLSHADIHRWQQETSHISDDSPDIPRHVLRPLPARNASPKKSSLRSPLKPRTPGRVVEFTNSVLSPVEQLIAREEQRQANAAISRASALAAPTAAPAAVPHISLEDETQNTGPSKGPQNQNHQRPHSQPERLSATTWSREHWLLLDSLMRRRKRGPFKEGYDKAAEKLLGRTVKSQGKSMALERWHLDCVDAFKAQVSGWDEAILAKRLVALILGEERRRRVKAKKANKAIFH